MTRPRQGVGSNQYATRPALPPTGRERRSAVRHAADDLDSEAVAWVFHPDRDQWENIGFRSWSAVQPHLHAGRSPEEAAWHVARTVDMTWAASGREIDQVAPWALRGFTWDASREWSRESFTADQAADWVNCGFTATEASRWFHEGYFRDAREARSWADVGYGDSDDDVRAAARARARGQGPAPRGD